MTAPQFFIQLNRAAGSSSVHFGPFADLDAATAFQHDHLRHNPGMIIAMNHPDDGCPNEVWSQDPYLRSLGISLPE